MTAAATFFAILVIAYVAGSVNFSILALRLVGRDDPRLHGSGNPGATNVYRQAGPPLAATVLLLDTGRAVAVALLAHALLPSWQVPWVGLGLILGNRVPCFHGFAGGKGVANYLGFTLAIAPAWAGVGVLAWSVAHLFWRTPFISSFAMVFFLAVGTTVSVSPHWQGIVGIWSTVSFIVACHHSNIRQRWGRKG